VLTRKDLVVGLIAALLAVWGLTSRAHDSGSAATTVDNGADTELYAAIVERMRAGEPYYRAAGTELSAQGYATLPVTNWRLPTLAIFEAALPASSLQPIPLIALGLVGVFAWYHAGAARGRAAWAAGLALLMLPAWASVKATWFHELWAGQLISLSLALWIAGRPRASLGAAAAALAVRELAVIYVVIMALLELRRRGWRALMPWVGLLALFGVVLLLHWSAAYMSLPEHPLRNSWVALGGWPFVLSAARGQVALLFWPFWIHALLVPALWWGLWRGRDDDAALPIVVTAYFVTLMVVGRPDNYYWGLLIAPLLPLGVLGWLPDRVATRPQKRQAAAQNADERSAELRDI